MAIAADDNALVRASIDAAPALATARLARRDEFFIAHCHARVYQGATALHAAAFAYDRETAQDLTEEIGLDDGVTALRQLGLIPKA